MSIVQLEENSLTQGRIVQLEEDSLIKGRADFHRTLEETRKTVKKEEFFSFLKPFYIEIQNI